MKWKTIVTDLKIFFDFIWKRIICLLFSSLLKIVFFIFNTVTTIIKMFYCPLWVIKKEKAFLSWVFIVIIFAPLASYLVFVDGFSAEKIHLFINSYSRTYTLTLCLSLLAPSVAEIGLSTFVNYKMDKDTKHIGLFVFHAITSFIFICLVTIVLCKQENEHHKLNLIISGITIVYTYLLYCISKMNLFPELDIFSTKTYSEEEKEELHKQLEKAEQVKLASVDGGKLKL